MEVDPFARPWAAWLGVLSSASVRCGVINELSVREKAEPQRCDYACHPFGRVRVQWPRKRCRSGAGTGYICSKETKELSPLLDKPSNSCYKAVAEWQISSQKDRARHHYFSPFWLALETARVQHKEETSTARRCLSRALAAPCVPAERTSLRLPAFGPTLPRHREEHGIAACGLTGDSPSIRLWTSRHHREPSRSGPDAIRRCGHF